MAKTVSLDDLQLSLGSKQNWFELSGHIDVDQDTVLELKSLLQTSPEKRFIPLDEKRYLALSKDLGRRMQEISQLSEVREDSVKMSAQNVEKEMAAKLPQNVEKSAGWPSGAAPGWAGH